MEISFTTDNDGDWSPFDLGHLRMTHDGHVIQSEGSRQLMMVFLCASDLGDGLLACRAQGGSFEFVAVGSSFRIQATRQQDLMTFTAGTATITCTRTDAILAMKQAVDRLASQLQEIDPGNSVYRDLLATQQKLRGALE